MKDRNGTELRPGDAVIVVDPDDTEDEIEEALSFGAQCTVLRELDNGFVLIQHSGPDHRFLDAILEHGVDTSEVYAVYDEAKEHGIDVQAPMPVPAAQLIYNGDDEDRW